MECETVRTRLAESLTGASSGDALAEHLEVCADCATHFDGLKDLDRRLDALPAILPRFAEAEIRILPTQPHRPPLAGFAAAALAAVAVLSVTAFYLIRPPAPAEDRLASRVESLLTALVAAEGSGATRSGWRS